MKRLSLVDLAETIKNKRTEKWNYTGTALRKNQELIEI